ncbi:hypothetical protein Bca101_017475 [Brassica carinata]
MTYLMKCKIYGNLGSRKSFYLTAKQRIAFLSTTLIKISVDLPRALTDILGKIVEVSHMKILSVNGKVRIRCERGNSKPRRRFNHLCAEIWQNQGFYTNLCPLWSMMITPIQGRTKTNHALQYLSSQIQSK